MADTVSINYGKMSTASALLGIGLIIMAFMVATGAIR